MPEVKNNKEEMPLNHYHEEFCGIDPVERAKALDISFEDGRFSLKMFNVPYTVTYPDGELASEDPYAPALTDAYAQILILRYLIYGQALPHTGQFKTFRELPWGDVYLTPFTGRCIKRAAFTFGNKLESFKKSAEALGGIPMPHGDAGYEFPYLGDYILRMYIWYGDDEFPPNAQILFSENFANGFSAEDSVVSAELLIKALKTKESLFKEENKHGRLQI